MIRNALIFLCFVFATICFFYSAMIFLPTDMKRNFQKLFSQPRVDDHMEQFTEVGAFPPGSEDAYEHLITALYFTLGLYFLILLGTISILASLVFLLISYILYLSKQVQSLHSQLAKRERIEC